MAVRLLVVFAALACTTWAKRTCPLEQAIAPCRCQSRNKGGVDLSCEKVKMDVISKALEATRLTEQPIIYLKFRQNNIGELPEDTFNGLQVSHIILTNSSITSIGARAFVGTDAERLELSHNDLHEVPSSALEHLPKLIFLTLSHNEIETLGDGAFRGLSALLHLSLFANKINSVDDDAFDGISATVTRLNLANNKLTTIPTMALRQLHLLEGLELQQNHITSIEWMHFQGLHKLDNIDLASNQITEIPSKAFGNETVINLVDLQDNNINSIDEDAFLGVEGTLEWLKLGNNDLGKIPSPALRRLRKLRQLDLHQNNISIIPEDAFDTFGGGLKYLGLQKNNIERVPVMSFSSMHTLQWLYLSDNQLQRIPLETYEPVIDTLINFDIHNNPLTCDCDLRWLRNWLTEANAKKLSSSPETQCLEPPVYEKTAVASIPPEHFTCPMYQSSSADERGTTPANSATTIFLSLINAITTSLVLCLC